MEVIVYKNPTAKAVGVSELEAMEKYLAILETRARMEKIGGI